MDLKQSKAHIDLIGQSNRVRGRRPADEWKGTRALGGSVPRKIPPGMLLHHNHVTENGFRAWLSPHKFEGFIQCPCGWSGLKHYAKRGYVQAFREGKHYGPVRMLTRRQAIAMLKWPSLHPELRADLLNIIGVSR